MSAFAHPSAAYIWISHSKKVCCFWLITGSQMLTLSLTDAECPVFLVYCVYNTSISNNNNNNNPFNGPLSTTTWVSWYQKNTLSISPYLCRYYSKSLINFLHYYSPQHPHLVTGPNWVWQLIPQHSPGFLSSVSRSYTLHFVIHNLFTQSSSSFLETRSYHLCHTNVIISSVPSLSQVNAPEPICYFNTTHPYNHSYPSPLNFT